jgi:glucose-1-phosphate adenylyltransferase
VLTQFLSVSLHRHIANTYSFDPFSHGFVAVLAAQQTNEAAEWYKGTADAVRQNSGFIQGEDVRDVLLLCGDQLYRMDFRRLIETHRVWGADVTIAAVPVARSEAPRMGVLCCEGDRITQITEKPHEAELDSLRTSPDWLAAHGLTGTGREYLANMGIYLFSRRVLDELLAAHPNAVDLVREIFPRSLQHYHYRVHLFTGYWDDLGSIKSYHEAHMALAGDQPPFDFASVEGVIFTRMRNLPASRIQDARVKQCLISDGCLVQAGSQLERCVIGARSSIGRNTSLRDTIVNGIDRHETAEERAENQRRSLPNLGIGENCVIERAIVDKNCRIGCNVHIVNQRRLRDFETPLYVIRDGIVVIPNRTVLTDGTMI